MKKTLITVLALLLATCACSQKRTEIPAAVRTAFEKQFPAAKELKWGKEDAHFEAEFDLNETEMSAVFDATGALLETETAIEPSLLPEAVQIYVVEHHTGQKIREAAKIIDKQGVITYEAEVNGKDLIFNSNGQCIRITK